jgi:homoserine kinase
VKRSVRAVVPASTSNLGPGFDLLGLALDVYLRVLVEVEGSFGEAGTARPTVELSWEGEGAEGPALVPVDSENLVVQGLLAGWEAAGLALDGTVRLHARSEIPVSRGLGSSGAAIVAGLVAANSLCEAALNRERLLALAAALEGHPDNVAPALCGGLVAAAVVGEGGHVVTRRATLFEEYLVAAVVPELALSTKLAREALPDSIAHREAVANQQRAFFLFDALAEGRTWDLRSLVADGLHQNYRAPLIPAFEDVCNTAWDHGAHAVWLSGSGPSLIVLVEGGPEKAEAIGRSVEARWAGEGVASRTLVLGADSLGAVVHEVEGED